MFRFWIEKIWVVRALDKKFYGAQGESVESKPLGPRGQEILRIALGVFLGNGLTLVLIWLCFALASRIFGVD